jgi:LysR family hydrogen peroxide-inducible transcriptional activator
MTLQQLEYIVAVDKYRHFVKAAEAQGVTQSTLSSMIQKLEQELDVQIFDRSAHPVRPTLEGEKILQQASVVLYHASQLHEMVLSERELETGEVKMGIIPTVAPYILPRLFKCIHQSHPHVSLHVSEARTSNIVERLQRAELDMALLATPLETDNLLEIPIYYERFLAYVSPSEPVYQQQEIIAAEMPTRHLWLLQEAHCMRGQVMNICHRKSEYSSIYEAGSIDTLVKIVDENGGYTIIPELHAGLLSPAQQANVRPLVNPEPVREISLVVRRDYVRERMLNIMASCVRGIIPEHMIDKRLKKYAIRL